MKKIFCFIIILFTSLTIAQVNDSIPKVVSNDSVPKFLIEMEEITVGDGTGDSDKEKAILKRRVYKVYPYAKLTSEKLTAMNLNMSKLKTEREKKKYFKIVENYLEDEFEGKLKKLSKKEGQILVKLIHRQTGITTFDLIKQLKSGWKAFWSNNTAKLFNINLKAEYNPYKNLEDFNIESILLVAFQNGTLQKQDPKTPIDIDKLLEIWTKKIEDSTKEN